MPESGAALPNASGAIGELPRISCIRPRRTWPMPWPPSSGGRCVAHRPRSLTCSCSGAIARRRPVESQLVPDRLQRPDLLAHELAHPVELPWKSGSVEKSQLMPVAYALRLAVPSGDSFAPVNWGDGEARSARDDAACRRSRATRGARARAAPARRSVRRLLRSAGAERRGRGRSGRRADRPGRRRPGRREHRLEDARGGHAAAW